MIIDEIRECIKKMNGKKTTNNRYTIQSKYISICVCTMEGGTNILDAQISVPLHNNEEILNFLESLRNSDLF
jgi:hypothetical protein